LLSPFSPRWWEGQPTAEARNGTFCESSELRDFLIRQSRNRRELVIFLGYAATGAVTQCVDIGAFLGFVRLGLPIEIAVAMAFALTMVVHFCLCRYVNFQNFERPVTQQIGTYVTVGAASLLLSVGVVSVLSRGFHLPPIAAKLCAVAISFPFNYLCNRYLTFGGGVRSAFVRWKTARASKNAESTYDRGTERIG
jgi:putative flippase GtrA